MLLDSSQIDQRLFLRLFLCFIVRFNQLVFMFIGNTYLMQHI